MFYLHFTIKTHFNSPFRRLTVLLLRNATEVEWIVLNKYKNYLLLHLRRNPVCLRQMSYGSFSDLIKINFEGDA